MNVLFDFRNYNNVKDFLENALRIINRINSLWNLKRILSAFLWEPYLDCYQNNYRIVFKMLSGFWRRPLRILSRILLNFWEKNPSPCCSLQRSSEIFTQYCTPFSLIEANSNLPRIRLLQITDDGIKSGISIFKASPDGAKPRCAGSRIRIMTRFSGPTMMTTALPPSLPAALLILICWMSLVLWFNVRGWVGFHRSQYWRVSSLSWLSFPSLSTEFRCLSEWHLHLSITFDTFLH